MQNEAIKKQLHTHCTSSMRNHPIRAVLQIAERHGKKHSRLRWIGTLWYDYTIRIAKLKTVHFQRNYKRSIHRDHCKSGVQRLRNLLQLLSSSFLLPLLPLPFLLLSLLLNAFGAKCFFSRLFVHWNTEPKQMLAAIIYLSLGDTHTHTVETRFWR